jgi:hypothetical protein
VSESNSARLQASKEWLRLRKAQQQGTPPAAHFLQLSSDTGDEADSTVGDDRCKPPPEPTRIKTAEWHSQAHRAAAECRRLYQAEAEKIDAELACRGTGKFRRGSSFKKPPKNNLDRNFVARVWFVAKMIEQKSWNCRAKGKHGGSIGGVGLEVLRTLLFVIKKVDGQLYPSLEAIAKLSRKSKQAVVTAINVLELMNFITVHRRVKRIQTPYGLRVVQDSNAYEFHLPTRGLGGLAMAVFCPPSESTKWDAIQHQVENHTESDRGDTEKKLGRKESDRWWLAEPLQTGNRGWR